MLTGNTHFAIGLHILTALAYNKGAIIPSSQLAQSVNTNAAFLRTVISILREAGLVETKLGKGGGAFLARPASEITLLDVYRATELCGGINQHGCETSPCELAQSMTSILGDISTRLDRVVALELEKTTIAELADKVDL